MIKSLQSLTIILRKESSTSDLDRNEFDFKSTINKSND